MRTDTKHFTVYNFAELSDSAKEKAREWYRNGNLEGWEWWDSVYEMYTTAGKMLGIEIENIYFSGFWSQGDGACFTGFYSYAKGWKEKLRAEFGGEWLEELEAIGNNLQELQSKWFYSIRARIKHSGRYSHENCTEFYIEYDENKYPDMRPENFREIEDGIKEILRDYMRNIYKSLEKEYEYLQSDECVDESIMVNGYEFLEDGTHY